ncbi:lipid A deacylase LpxR family protein [Shewanella sp. UCD-KL12]|uniref:lipid A deacylase LpxR family protein n=1 Tax=Shewanella sp. UCD-KL12 TaxID=1917163 RepID=UPI000970B50C|nr:lipid A deacylase LpxR family protein [Shewanella sp. UCD-KL12]
MTKQTSYSNHLKGACLPLLFIAPFSTADQWHIQLDNDIIFGDDGNYTNAIIVGWESQPLDNLTHTVLPIQWQANLAFNQSDAQRAWGVTLVQQMWTPGLIEIESPQAHDRPYAGYLAIESHTATYGKTLAQKNWVSLGVVGPASGNELMQSFVHKITDSSAPQGWDYQIENQLTIQAAYEVDALIGRTEPSNSDFLASTQWELSGFSHSQLGNFRSETDIGLTLRWGNELANSFGRLSQHSGQYGNISATTPSSTLMVYSRAYVGYRFNDLTLEGDLPYDSFVELENRQAGLNLGVIWAQPNWSLGWSFNTYTREYESNYDKWHGYGSLQFSWNI